MSTLHRDDRRGHFVLDLGPSGSSVRFNERRHVVGGDLGPRLHLTTYDAHLTPDDARTLAEALTWWADRAHDATENEDRIVEVGDLLELLAEQEAST